jgi:predicted RND superfamily exporter protein
VRVRLTGDVPLADQDFASLQENIGLVGAIMVAAMLLTLWLATRSVRMVGAIMGTIILGLLVTLALGLLAVGRLNLISIAFIPLFVGLGVDFGIQICVRFAAERMRKPGACGDGAPDVRQALAAAAQALSAPLTLAAGPSCSALPRSCPRPMSALPNWA